MCGRFALGIPKKRLEEFLGIPLPDFAPSWNIAPTRMILAVALGSDGRPLGKFFRWGLAPRWAKDAKPGAGLINARAESAAHKPAFREAFARRRCVVPAQGFYEWTAAKGGKQPWLITMKSGEPMLLAAIWEPPRPGVAELPATCAILTCPANAEVSALHERMPVILPRPALRAWLGAASRSGEPVDPAGLMRPSPDGELLIRPADPRVNNPTNDGPELAVPAAGGEDDGKQGQPER